MPGEWRGRHSAVRTDPRPRLPAQSSRDALATGQRQWRPRPRAAQGLPRARQPKAGTHIAAVAVARKLAVFCWHLLTRGEDYCLCASLACAAKASVARAGGPAGPRRGARGGAPVAQCRAGRAGVPGQGRFGRGSDASAGSATTPAEGGALSLEVGGPSCRSVRKLDLPVFSSHAAASPRARAKKRSMRGRPARSTAPRPLSSRSTPAGRCSARSRASWLSSSTWNCRP